MHEAAKEARAIAALSALGREVAASPHRLEALVAEGDRTTVRAVLAWMLVSCMGDQEVGELCAIAPATWAAAERVTGAFPALDRLRIRAGLDALQSGRRSDGLPSVVAGVEIEGSVGAPGAPLPGERPPDLVKDLTELRRIADSPRDDASLELLLSRMVWRGLDYTFDKVAAIAEEIHTPPISSAWCREFVWAWFGSEYLPHQAVGRRRSRLREWPSSIVARIPVTFEREGGREEKHVFLCLAAPTTPGRVLTQWARPETMDAAASHPRLMFGRSRAGQEVWVHDRGHSTSSPGNWLVELFDSKLGDALRARRAERVGR